MEGDKLNADLAGEIQKGASLKHVETTEKNPLPDKDTIQTEKGQQAVISGVEGFSKDQLKSTETTEKNVLPSKEDVCQEKVINDVEHFNKCQLKHAQTDEKNKLPTQAEINDEKSGK